MTDSPFNLFPVKGKHMIRDVQRSAEEIGVGFRWPDAFRNRRCWQAVSR
jgi:hypothetical protein